MSYGHEEEPRSWSLIQTESFEVPFTESTRSEDTSSEVPLDGVEFRGPNGKTFSTNRRYLSVNAPALLRVLQTQAAQGPLEEDDAVLEFLVGFINPGEQPALENEPFESVMAVAKAAEKYEVYSAMNFCRYIFKQTLPTHALEIFGFSAHHNKVDLADTAAPLLLEYRAVDVVAVLPRDWGMPWVHYAAKWQEFLYEKEQYVATMAGRPAAGKTWICTNCKPRFVSMITTMRLNSVSRTRTTVVIPACGSGLLCERDKLLGQLMAPQETLGRFSTMIL